MKKAATFGGGVGTLAITIENRNDQAIMPSSALITGMKAWKAS